MTKIYEKILQNFFWPDSTYTWVRNVAFMECNGPFTQRFYNSPPKARADDTVPIRSEFPVKLFLDVGCGLLDVGLVHQGDGCAVDRPGLHLRAHFGASNWSRHRLSFLKKLLVFTGVPNQAFSPIGRCEASIQRLLLEAVLFRGGVVRVRRWGELLLMEHHGDG